VTTEIHLKTVETLTVNKPLGEVVMLLNDARRNSVMVEFIDDKTKNQYAFFAEMVAMIESKK
jgi:hypothetical protein